MYNPLDEFGNQLREKREKSGLTQRQLAEHLGISYRTILQIETHKSNPKLDTVFLLAKEMGISLDALIYPETTLQGSIPKCVYDYFQNKSPTDAQHMISILKNLEGLQKNTLE